MAYLKTEEGQRAFKERSALMSPRLRAAFILFDGNKSADQVMAATQTLGVVRADVDLLVSHGFLKDNASPATLGVVSSAAPAPVLATAPGGGSPGPATDSVRSAQERFAQAWPLATQLTASLGLFGFRLNLAVEGAAGYNDLLALLPKIKAAVGAEKCANFERALKD